MKTLRDLADQDRAMRCGEFISYAKHLAAARGDFSNAAGLAAKAPQKVRELLQKAAVTSAGGDAWGAQLEGYATLASGFVDSLRWSSIFYRMLGDGALVRLPFDVRVGSIGTAAGAAVVSPGMAIPVRQMSLSPALLERRKAAGLVVLSNELLTAGGSAAEALISRSLRGSVGLAVDEDFVANIVLAGVTAGTATPAVLTDLATVLTAAALTDESRPYWLAAPDVALRLATLAPAAPNSVVRLFPEVSPLGQSILLGFPLLVSSAVPAATLVLVDASGIGGASDTVEVGNSRHAALEMSDTPSMTTGASGAGSPAIPVPVNPVSMWQTDSQGIRVIAYFGAARLRTTGVAALDTISW